VLDPNASDAQRDNAVAAIASNGGDVVALFDPVAVISEGDDSTQTALNALIGNGVLTLDSDGSLDPSSLGLSDDLLALVAAWTQSFSSDVQNALANRFREGDEWGFPGSCEIS
jgi:hypothetical protein